MATSVVNKVLFRGIHQDVAKIRLFILLTSLLDNIEIPNTIHYSNSKSNDNYIKVAPV